MNTLSNTLLEFSSSRRKVILFLAAAAMLIASTYGAAALHRPAQAALPKTTTLGVDAELAASHMMTTDELLSFWKKRFVNDPQDFISLTYLGQTYLRKGRETGDVSEYEKAEAIFRQALSMDPGYEVGQADLSAALFVRHDFQDALQLATKIYDGDPLALQALATAGDAQLELGRYPQAAAAYQTLQQEVPGAAVYSRLARLAFLDGHTSQAIGLMQQAVNDSAQRGLTGETAAWYHFQLGELYFSSGQLSPAETQYSAALQQFNDYYLALGGMGKVRAAQGRYSDAIAYYEKAVAIIPQPDLLAALGDLYSVTGDAAHAQREYATVQFIGKLAAINRVIYNRQLALFDANHDTNLAESLQLAEAELQNRKDIYAYDTAAWALYKNGRYADALATMQQALKLGTRDAMLYYHAGMIYKALGDDAQAHTMLGAAMAINPHFDLLQARIAHQALVELQWRVLRGR